MSIYIPSLADSVGFMCRPASMHGAGYRYLSATIVLFSAMGSVPAATREDIQNANNELRREIRSLEIVVESRITFHKGSHNELWDARFPGTRGTRDVPSDTITGNESKRLVVDFIQNRVYSTGNECSMVRGPDDVSVLMTSKSGKMGFDGTLITGLKSRQGVDPHSTAPKSQYPVDFYELAPEHGAQAISWSSSLYPVFLFAGSFLNSDFNVNGSTLRPTFEAEDWLLKSDVEPSQGTVVLVSQPNANGAYVETRLGSDLAYRPQVWERYGKKGLRSRIEIAYDGKGTRAAVRSWKHSSYDGSARLIRDDEHRVTRLTLNPDLNDVAFRLTSTTRLDADLAEVIGDWTERQSRSTGVTVKWDEHREEIDMEWVRKHGADPELKALIAEKGMPAAIEKIPVIAFDMQKELRISNECFSYSFSGERIIDGIMQPQQLDIVCDGVRRIDFSAAYKQGGHASANIYAPTKAMGPNNSYLAVILYSRPFDLRLGGVSKGDLSLVAATDLVDGRPCTVVEGHAHEGGKAYRMWLDEARGFAPLRIAAFKGDGELDFQLDVEYIESDTVIRPSGWRLVDHKYSPLGKSVVTARVREWKTAESLSAQDFQVEFPVGTTVSDFTGAEEHSYIIQASAKRRDVLKEEMGQSHDVLMTTDTGSALSRSTHWTVWCVLLVIVLLVLTGGLFVFYRRGRVDRLG